MKRKGICAAIALTLVLGVFSGCQNAEQRSTNKVKLEFWCANAAKDNISNYNEVESFRKLQELAGVDVEFIHPSTAASGEQFNVMIASGEYPDIISWNWSSGYVGGIEKAYSDGVIVKLDDYTDKLQNYIKMIDANPDYKSAAYASDGSLYCLGALKEQLSLNVFYGPMIREDWLKKLNLNMPQSIEDWYAVLKAFKTQDPNGNGKADEIPFAGFSGDYTFHYFSGAYGVLKGQFHPKPDGSFVYGSIEPEYKEFITEMHKWYEEGLIDQEFASVGKNIVDANMTNGISGATIGYLGGQMGNYLAAKQDDASYSIAGTPWPSVKSGAPQYCSYPTMKYMIDAGSGAAITTQNKHVEETLKFLNCCYSEEGTVLQNYGIENVSYTKEGDSYRFTDLILKNPDGLSPAQAITPYALTKEGGTKMMLSDAYNQIMQNYPQQNAAVQTWASGDLSLLTPNYQMSTEDRKKCTSILNAVETYENEMLVKMVMGIEPISKFDEYVSTIKSFGIDEAIQIHKAAYEKSMAK